MKKKTLYNIKYKIGDSEREVDITAPYNKGFIAIKSEFIRYFESITKPGVRTNIISITRIGSILSVFE